MKNRRIVITLLIITALAIGMVGCDEFWSLDTSNPVQVTSRTTFLVTADGEDPLDARTQVEQLLTKWKYKVTTAGDSNNNTLHLIISYEYLPENELCRSFKFVLRDAKDQYIKSGTHLSEKPLQELLDDFNSFLIGESLFKKQ